MNAPDLPADVTVTEIGARGDGIARLAGAIFYIPFSVPGEVYRVTKAVRRGDGLAAIKADLIAAAQGRREPACSVYGHCGGCSLQHVDDPVIASEKRRLLINALGRKGFHDLTVHETVTTPPGQRRRARFAARKTQKGWIIGFNARASKQIVPFDTCPVLVPALQALPGKLAKMLLNLPSFGPVGDIHVTETDTGIELCLFPATVKALTLDERYFLTDWAEAEDIARLIWGSDRAPEPVIVRRDVEVTFGDRRTGMPPAAFLQPSVYGERALAERVVNACRDARRVADLFCGCGSLTLPLVSAGHAVHAVEQDAAMIAALRRSQGGAVSSEVRDLDRRPLEPGELALFDAVVFDPPRAGALAQSQALAASNVKTVVAVSCNPATLARDLRVLADGGYAIESVTPVDQFTWSSHLEALAVLRRPD